MIFTFVADEEKDNLKKKDSMEKNPKIANVYVEIINFNK